MFTLDEIKGQEQAKKAMNEHYTALLDADNTEDRKEHFSFMKKLFDKYVCIRKIWEYVENAKRYVSRFFKKITDALIEQVKHDYFYIMKFRDYIHDDFFIKIGSSVHPEIRLKQHERNYKGCSGTILYTYETGDVNSSSVENEVRDYFIRKYGEENFIPNDRFTCEIDLQDIISKVPLCVERLRAAKII